MARNDPQVNLRIPADLKGRLEQSALERNRSLTAEMVLRLQSSFSLPALRDDLKETIDKHAGLFVEMEHLLLANRALSANNSFMSELLKVVVQSNGNLDQQTVGLIAKLIKGGDEDGSGLVELMAETISAGRELEEFRRDPLKKMPSIDRTTKAFETLPEVQRIKSKAKLSEKE